MMERPEDVAPVDPGAFKNALRTWASGVTIVTASAGERFHGMTVSAFSSVSVAPPLVLVCANRESMTHELIQRSGGFAVNILGASQQALSTRFASVEGPERFDGVRFSRGVLGFPLLDGALSHIECRVRNAHEEGTHMVYIGEVVNVAVHPREPLLYFDGDYTGVAQK